MQGTDGGFYGTTFYGPMLGAYGYGTIFSLNVGLGPFVKTVPASGKVGAKVTILGTDLASRRHQRDVQRHTGLRVHYQLD